MPLDIGRGRLKWTPVARQGGTTVPLASVKADAVLGDLYDKRIEGNVILTVDGDGEDGQPFAVKVPGPARTTWVVGSGRWHHAGADENVVVMIQPGDGFDAGNPLTYNEFWFFRADGTVLADQVLAGDIILFHFNYPVEIYEGIPA